MKIVSYNINGIRAALNKGLLDWVAKESPDILCFQEIKAFEEQIPMDKFEELGYTGYVHSAEKKGYSGVATFSKKKAKLVNKESGMKAYDSEGRILRTDFGSLSLLNCYFPSGSSGEDRHAFKMKYLNDFGPWIKKLLSERKRVIVLGDYNVVHLDIDIHNPTRKDKPSGFRPEERAWMDDWFAGDFKDAFRIINNDLPDQYSWWSYRSGARKKNKGWRIDYISVSNSLSKKVKDARHAYEAEHSDHVPVIAELDL